MNYHGSYFGACNNCRGCVDFSFLKDRHFQRYLLYTVIVCVLVIVSCDKVIMPLVVSSSGTVRVPNIIGLQQAQAIDLLESKGLRVERIIEQFNDTIARGVVVSQAPFPQSDVKEGRRVYLTVSKGYESLSMPGLYGMTLRDAQISLMRLGLQVGNVGVEFNDSLPDNSVIRQSYSPGMSVNAGSSINLVVSRDTSLNVIVPSLERLSYTDALRSLEYSNLVAGNVVHQRDETYSAGTVLRQSPAAGTRMRSGSRIDLWVSSSE